jgi:flagellar biogenesis protein FliO
MIAGRAALAGRAARLGPLLMLFAATPAASQRLGQGAGTDISIWRVILALLFCLALGGAAIYVLRRRFRGVRPLAFGRERRLELHENMRLSHQVDLCIVSRDGHEYLIATSPQGVTLVDRGPFEALSQEAVAGPPEASA